MSAGPAALAKALPGIDIGPELGRGGFGIVYSGRQRRLGREVAIKQLPPVFADDAEIRERFVTEARVLAALDHPHIVPVYDYVEEEGLCLLVMECLPGGTVWDVFRKEGVQPGHACVIVIAAAAGLHHAHENGVLHRDVKPENLLLTSNRHLKVTDFGIAKVIGGADAIATTNGDILGTPAYMAPEQATGEHLGPAADVYAAGVMLYELLSGRLPYSQEGGGLAIVYRHLHESPVPLQDTAPEIPRPVAEVVMRALAREPRDRYATAEEFAVAVGEAAVDGFGRDWYTGSGIRVIGSEQVMGTLTGPGFYRRRGDSTVNRSPDTVERAPRTQPGGLFVQGGTDDRSTRRESWIPAAEAPAPTAWRPGPGARPDTGAGPDAGPDGACDLPVLRPADLPRRVDPLPRVRPEDPQHVVGVLSIVGRPEPLVPVRQILDVPPSPTRLFAATGVLLVLLLVAALVGLGTSSDGSGTTTGAVTVAGTDVGSGGDVTADLGSGVPVTVAAPGGAQAARLTLSLHGLQIGQSDRAPLSGGRATLKVSSVRFLVAGPVDARLDLLGADGRAVADRHFSLGPRSSGFLTIPGVVLALAVLFALAYLESLTRPLWKLGRWRARAGIGLGLIGALVGVVLSGLAWVLGLHQLSPTTAIVCAVLGAALGVVGGVLAARWGLRRRVVRINRRTPILR